MPYYIAVNGTQTGPHTEQEIRERLARNEIDASTLAWKEGLPDWLPLSEVLVKTSPLSAEAPVPLPQTGLPPFPSWEPASLGLRFGAAVIDGLLVLIPMILAVGIVKAVGGESEDGSLNSLGFVVFAPFLLLVFGIAGFQIYMLVKHAQTLGKRLCKIRIYQVANGQQATWIQAVLLRAVVNGVIGSVPCLGILYTLVDICFIFRTDRRCVHDLIAGTVVGTAPEK